MTSKSFSFCYLGTDQENPQPLQKSCSDSGTSLCRVVALTYSVRCITVILYSYDF